MSRHCLHICPVETPETKEIRSDFGVRHAKDCPLGLIVVAAGPDGAVRPWGEGYLKAFKVHWEKTTLESVVAGEWAIERNSYKSTDTPQGGGAAVEDTGQASTLTTTTLMDVARATRRQE